GRISVESVVRCSWNGWPDDRGIRSRSRCRRSATSSVVHQPLKSTCRLRVAPTAVDAGSWPSGFIVSLSMEPSAR
ncbi:hypothetical protein FA132_34610, partial [Pseudomonas aeruginosa]|nr:hypothetical protein [Pseudomonas aeruginosa]